MRGGGLCLTWAIMKRTTILKGLAICSSVVLAGGFVVYRQKQAPDTRNEEEPIMPSSKSRPVILPSSKNIDVIFSNLGGPGSAESGETPANSESFHPSEEGKEKEAEKVLLPSSKHIEMPVFKLPVKPAGDPPPENSKGKTLLPSSKIGAILTPKDVPEKEAASAQESKPKGEP